jgi:predicted permease
MEATFTVALEKIIAMYALMISSYLLQRRFHFSISDLNNLIFSFFLPISIFYSITAMPSFTMLDFLLMASSGFIIIGLASLLSALLASNFFHLDPSTKKTFLLGSSYGNYGFLGLPVAFSLYGTQGAVLALFFLIGSYLFLYTVGLYIMNGEISLEGFFKNPLILTTLLSIACLLLDLRPHPFISSTLSLANQVTFPLSMFVVGGGLQFGFYLKTKNLVLTLLAALIKLILSPILALIIGYIIPLSKNQGSIMILQSAMPTGVLVTVFSLAFSGNVALSNSIVSSTTLFSLFTIIFILFVVC